MSEPESGFGHFLRELRRRRVVRVAIVYAVVGWVLIEVADTIAPHLGLPDWLATLVIVLVAIGFPLALVLAWAFDVTPEGVRRTPSTGVGKSGARNRALPLIALGAAVALALALVLWLRPTSDERPVLPAVTEANPSLVAVLPFSVRGDAAMRDLGSGMVNLLGTKLDGAGELRTVDSRALLSVLEHEHTRVLGPAGGRSVALAVWNVAVYVRDPDAALDLARVLARPTRSLEARTVGHAWAAHLLLARGRLDAARRELELGRAEDALAWYLHLAELSPFETPYLAIGHVRQAGIHDLAGRSDEARRHDERARELWAGCDPGLCTLLDR